MSSLLFACLILQTQTTIWNHKFITTDLDELLWDAKTNHDMAIIGNPLLLDKCANAVLDDEHKHSRERLEQNGIPASWFWSRETLDASIRGKSLHRRLKVTHALDPKITSPFITPWSALIATDYAAEKEKSIPLHIPRWFHKAGQATAAGSDYADDYATSAHKLELLNNKEFQQAMHNVYYYHIEKAGSSTLGYGVLGGYLGYNHSYMSENQVSHAQCGFTFVREPISRFISGYYTVNRLIYGHNVDKTKKAYRHPHIFNWFNVVGEPARFATFVDDLLQFGYGFLVESPLEHMMSQSGILSIAQIDVHFIGRLRSLTQHWSQLVEFCNSSLLQPWPEKDYSRMQNYGTRGLDEHPEYAKMMGLEDYEEGDLLPAYKVVADSYDLYAKIAHFYRQDFVCFGFDMDFVTFRDSVYAKWNATMTRKQSFSQKHK